MVCKQTTHFGCCVCVCDFQLVQCMSIMSICYLHLLLTWIQWKMRDDIRISEWMSQGSFELSIDPKLLDQFCVDWYMFIVKIWLVLK